MKSRVLIGFLFVALTCHGGEPTPGAENPAGNAKANLSERLRLRAPAAAQAVLALPAFAEQSKRQAESSLEPNQVGVSRRAEIDVVRVLDHGRLQWEPVDGGFAAQLRVTSEGAAALRVGVRFTSMPRELEIRVARELPDGTIEGVYATTGSELAKLHAGFVPIDLWTPSTAGETQIIEYWVAGAKDRDSLNFSVFDVSHLLQPVLEPAGPKALKYSCHIDVACVSGQNVSNDRRAVSRMVYVKNGNSYVCTGSLLNDRASSLTPLFATANHCISSGASAATLETWWFYYPSTCGGAPADPVRLMGGASLLLTDFDTDFSLLRLARSAPGGAYFLGWDPARLAAGQSVFGLHHPDGRSQRYSSGSFVERLQLTNAGTGVMFGELFSKISFTQGIVEGGSSGSPLITAPAYFRGTLFGSPSSNSCASTTRTAFYSDFAAVYPLIDVYLRGPTSTDDYGDSASAAALVSSNTQFFGEINRVGDQDWFRFVFSSAGRWTIASFAAAAGSPTDLIGDIYAADGTTLLASNDDRLPSDVNFEMTRNVTSPGTFYVRARGFQSTVGRYGIRSNFVQPDDHGDSSATATNSNPNGASGGYLGFPTDSDWFRFAFDRDGVFKVESTGTTDVIGRIYQSDGVTLVAENDDAAPPDRNFAMSVSVRGPATGYLKVTGYEGATGSYGLAMSFVAQQSAGCTQATVYRYRNTQILGHFYTTNQADGAARIAAGEPIVLEGAAFNACSGGSKSAGIYPVYRFKHLQVPGVYFYSMLEAELDVVRATLTGLLREEGIAYYAFNFNPAGTFPVYRFRNASVAGANFYTIDEGERAIILANVPGYPIEGIGFWAMPPSATP